MSWQAFFDRNEPNYFESQTESNRFGLDIARLEVPFKADPNNSLDWVVQKVTSSEADVVILRYPNRYGDWFEKLHATRRDLIYADTLVYWGLDINTDESFVVSTEPYVADWNSQIDDKLRKMLRDTFVGYSNHYSSNPLLEPRGSLEGYLEWAESVINDGHMLVLRNQFGEALGFSALQFVDGSLDMVLGGGAQSLKAKGLYTARISANIGKAHELGAARVVTSTQAHNTIVQNVWGKRYGFTMRGALTTVHLVKRGLLRR